MHLDNEYYSHFLACRFLSLEFLLDYIFPTEDIEIINTLNQNIENLENYNYSNIINKYRIDFDREGKGPLPTVSMGIPVRGCVERARFLGNESLVEFKMDFDNSIFRVTVPSVFLPKTGQPLWLTIPRDRCFVFPT